MKLRARVDGCFHRHGPANLKPHISLAIKAVIPFLSRTGKSGSQMSAHHLEKPATKAPSAIDWQAYVEDFRRAGHETVDWIARYLATIGDSRVLAQVKPGQLFDALPSSAP